MVSIVVSTGNDWVMSVSECLGCQVLSPRRRWTGDMDVELPAMDVQLGPSFPVRPSMVIHIPDPRATSDYCRRKNPRQKDRTKVGDGSWPLLVGV